MDCGLEISYVHGIKIDNSEKRPKFRITGVSREITDEQIIKDLADQNEENMNIIQEERKKTDNNEEPEEIIKDLSNIQEKNRRSHRRNETEMALKILQINIEKGIQASKLMRAKADKEKYDIILVREPATRTKKCRDRSKS
ncbi:hypothetical protein GWI33_013007 [Rhynchophorus ferrugineus]|uniref:Uncharacterized protein n=1 Tax=Rhynchophorus ferrugineus TaxID=354439 RepID=A0A834I4K2_RHYFE|nr:hypothetical protein GWI33_013007 [Rhynchophorus ferrugineus]